MEEAKAVLVNVYAKWWGNTLTGYKYLLNPDIEDEESFFDKTKTLIDGAILFSQFSAGWQSCLYQNNPLLDADKPLISFSLDEWNTLFYGSDSPLKIEIHSNNTGRTDKVDLRRCHPALQTEKSLMKWRWLTP